LEKSRRYGDGQLKIHQDPDSSVEKHGTCPLSMIFPNIPELYDEFKWAVITEVLQGSVHYQTSLSQ
jgi:hypothetical protein